MSGTAELTPQVLGRAMDIARAAYEEALRRHGMLAGTIALISVYAEENLAEVNGEDDAAISSPVADSRRA
ncbi:hypothetical protein GCM10010191_12490 [Actinomadura vinacea]|uniref:Uncharacterized protein n=2 Tax=Actinomadura vinacea TaxID=115336 RepID=A0ABN3IL65_9ACTN